MLSNWTSLKVCCLVKSLNPLPAWNAMLEIVSGQTLLFNSNIQRIDGWVNGWIDGRMDGWVSGWMDQQDGWMDRWGEWQNDRSWWMNDGWGEGQNDGCVGGWMVRRMDVWGNGCLGACMDSHKLSYLFISILCSRLWILFFIGHMNC